MKKIIIPIFMLLPLMTYNHPKREIQVNQTSFNYLFI